MMIEKSLKSTPSVDTAIDVAKVAEGTRKRSDAPVVPSRQTRWPPAEEPATPILAGADRGRAVVDPGGPSWYEDSPQQMPCLYADQPALLKTADG